MESLELLQAVLPGTAALVQGTAGHLFAADHTRINVLDTALRLRSTIPFDQAFLGHSQPLEALACDRATNRIAAVSGARVGVWEAGPAESWRLHSSFLVNHLVTSIDFAQGTIAAGGDAVSVWTLDDTHGTPVWRQIALEARATAVLEVKLSPFADILASVSVASNIVRLSQINQPSSGSTFSALKFLAQASHSQRVRSIGWRPDKCSTDSGPILHTTTIDGRFRIWGCMIDEPDFFSLWATLDVHAESDGSVPISTNFHRTTSMWEAKEGESGARMGTKDDFVTVFSNGSLYSTTVVNLDCRPPTCLSQSSRLLPSQPFSKDQLPNLRHTVLVAEDDGSTLLARCSRGTLIRARLPDALPLAGPAPPPVAIAVNSTGTIQRIVPSHGGGSFVLLGAQGTIQGWRLEEQGVQPSFVAESACPLGSKLASWDNGRMTAIVSSSAIEVLEVQVNGRVKLLATLPFDSPSTSTISTLVVAKASLEDTTLVATTSDHVALIWTISSNPFAISEQAILEHTTSICLTTTVPPRSVSTASESATVLSIEEDGTLSFWTIALPLEANSEWKLGTSVHTGRQSPVLAACSSESMTAVVAKSLDSNELSIWDSKESEYASGLQFSLVISGDVNHVRWSDDSGTLAVASATEVKLLCSQLLDDLSGAPSWITYATVSVDHLTTSPISTLSWLSTGALAIASNELLFLHSPLLTSGINCHQFTAERSAPLPYHHPQLLFQCLLHGKLHVVVKILVGLAGQLTETGELTPIEIKSTEIKTITMDDFLTGVDGPVKATGPDSDIFLALTNAASRQSNGIKSLLTDEDTQRLLAAIHKCTLRGLSKLEHAHLALLVQTVFEVQTQQNSLDANGLRYLISMRSYFIYSTAILPASPTLGPSRQPTSRLKYRDMVWAFHSESQDVLLEASIKACPGKLTWENAKALGLFMWLRSPEVIASQMEAVGRCEYTKDPEEKNPIAASLFYLALKKKHMVITLWRQAGGHSDQRSMLKLLVNDFDEPRWKSAALKNAYALMSKRRFHFAAAFFLLGGSLKDAVNVCVRQIDDFQLAIALARAHEGDSGPVLRTILEEHVIPFAFKVGFRWLASWSFWMLNRKDLAIQTIITPLASLASTLPYKLVSIGSPIHEDPCLVLLFGQLRSWSLQTVKGAIAVSGQTEFNFVLHMCRVLCRMGCHVLAFDLVREWEFVRPEPPPSRVARLPSLRPGHSLRRLSTKLDLEISSNLPSRAPSPDRESGAAAFHEVLKKVKKETAAPAEFSFDSFAF